MNAQVLNRWEKENQEGNWLTKVDVKNVSLKQFVCTLR